MVKVLAFKGDNGLSLALWSLWSWASHLIKSKDGAWSFSKVLVIKMHFWKNRHFLKWRSWPEQRFGLLFCWAFCSPSIFHMTLFDPYTLLHKEIWAIHFLKSWLKDFNIRPHLSRSLNSRSSKSLCFAQILGFHCHGWWNMGLSRQVQGAAWSLVSYCAGNQKREHKDGRWHGADKEGTDKQYADIMHEPWLLCRMRQQGRVAAQCLLVAKCLILIEPFFINNINNVTGVIVMKIDSISSFCMWFLEANAN